MNADEISQLLKAAPPERRLLYQTALSTGLRSREIKGLQVQDLNPDLPALNIRAEIAKSRKPALQPLPRDLWRRLQGMFQAKAPGSPIFDLPRDLSLLMDIDLKAAGIPKWTPEGKLDFHALRVSFISRMIEAGATVKEAQTLARHSTPDLTMNTYARTSPRRLQELADGIGEALKIGDFNITGPQQKVAGLKSFSITKGCLVPGEGIEPSRDLRPTGF